MEADCINLSGQSSQQQRVPVEARESDANLCRSLEQVHVEQLAQRRKQWPK